jgi:hypothetical protein
MTFICFIGSSQAIFENDPNFPITVSNSKIFALMKVQELTVNMSKRGKTSWTDEGSIVEN